MNIKEALIFGAKQPGSRTLTRRFSGARLKSAKVSLPGKLKKTDSPQLDAAILLSSATKKSKEFLYTYPEKKLTPAQIKKYKNYISRRAKHEPVAYIAGKKEFYGFEFLVSPAVLIPRPDTETLISAILSTVGVPVSYIIDVGTGSGAIAITLKKLMPKTRVFASDISTSALNLAKKNARNLKVKITFKTGNLLSPFKSLLSDVRHPIVIITNLPYLSRAEWQKTAPEVKKYEPYSALVGGKTGTEIYEKLFKKLRDANTANSMRIPRIILFIEIGHNQKSTIAKLAKTIIHPKKIEFIKDLAGKWRVAKIVVGS